MSKSNILPDLRPLVLWNKGENYVFCGCMRVLMERVEPDNPLFATPAAQYPATYLGVHPLTDVPYAAAFDGIGVPEGAAIYGCFGENFSRASAPDAIPGLTRVNSPKELVPGSFYTLPTDSEYEFVILMADGPVDFAVTSYDTNRLFDFYGGISGDGVAQTYGRGFRRADNGADMSLSAVWDGAELCGYVFGEIGYSHTYVTHTEIGRDKARYIGMVKAYIDRGIPVLQRRVPDGPKQGSCYSLIVGYGSDGGTILYLDGNKAQPKAYDTDGDIQWDFVFAGDKRREIDVTGLYVNALRRARDILTAADHRGFSFGAKAFRDWADDVERGVFAEDGHEYTTYVCQLATNGSTHDSLFTQMYEKHPEWSFLEEITGRFYALAHDGGAYAPRDIWGRLEKLGGGFGVTAETMRDAEKRAQIAGLLRDAAAHMDEVVRALDEGLARI